MPSNEPPAKTASPSSGFRNRKTPADQRKFALVRLPAGWVEQFWNVATPERDGGHAAEALRSKVAGTVWNAGFSRHSPPQAGGGTDLIRRDGAAARPSTRGSNEPLAALRAAVPAEAGVPSRRRQPGCRPAPHGCTFTATAQRSALPADGVIRWVSVLRLPVPVGGPAAAAQNDAVTFSDTMRGAPRKAPWPLMVAR